MKTTRKYDIVRDWGRGGRVAAYVEGAGSQLFRVDRIGSVEATDSGDALERARAAGIIRQGESALSELGLLL